MSAPRRAGPKDARPLHSDAAADPDMAELVEHFVAEVIARMAALRDALDNDQIETVRWIARQVKGAAGGYGFPAIGDAAAQLEAQTLDEEASFSQLTESVENLITLCRRATARAL